MKNEETVRGVLKEIRFHKDNFLIARLEDGNSVKGHMAAPQLGLEYSFQGKWVANPPWGKTFVFSHYSRSHPKTLEGIRAYLEENAPWVGAEISKKIVNVFGEKTLEILKSDPARVATEISGITPARAKEISEMLKRFQDSEEMEIALNDIFNGLPVSSRARQKIIQLWGADALDKIRANPYQLIEKVKGIGFLTADRIAKRVGFELEGYPRIQAGVVHALNDAAWGSGHTFLPKDRLIEKAKELLTVDPARIVSFLPRMVEDQSIVMEGDSIYLPALYRDEVTVAKQLKGIGGPA